MNFLAYFLLSIGMLMGTYSCQSQKNSFDLTEDALGKHVQTILQKDIKTRRSALAFTQEYDFIQTSSRNILNFNNINFEGFGDENSYYLRNFIIFHFPKKDSLISAYHLRLYQTENTWKLNQVLEKILGNPTFIGYETEGKKQVGKFRSKVWLDTENNYTYLFYAQDQLNGMTESSLYVVDNKDKKYHNHISTSSMFYFLGDYLKYKERFKKPTTFSYKDFVEESLENGSEQYAKLSEWE